MLHVRHRRSCSHSWNHSALLSTVLMSDTTAADKVSNLDEVVIVSETGRGKKRSVKGRVASIDEHLGELGNVNLIRRGSYAWEPVVNNMQTERLSTTIDGMKIFYACTDKMDPVTSYVESGNMVFTAIGSLSHHLSHSSLNSTQTNSYHLREQRIRKVRLTAVLSRLRILGIRLRYSTTFCLV